MVNNATKYDEWDEPVGFLMIKETEQSVCPVMSAGNNKHEYTNVCAWEKIKLQFYLRN